MDEDVRSLCSDAWWAQVNRRERERRSRARRRAVWTFLAALAGGLLIAFGVSWLNRP